MSNVNTTITIKKFIKKELENCKKFSYEHWDDVILRLIKMYKKYKPNKKSDDLIDSKK